ncbi:MAG: glycogen/starch/alpha-glucan family phosphorylase [Cyanobacteria bacterium RM1_2_2]|nr:glycogen/starch/alpha-glucan family phosphorylase [Cyanobacteria bacterium RM1_2_2]
MLQRKLPISLKLVLLLSLAAAPTMFSQPMTVAAPINWVASAPPAPVIFAQTISFTENIAESRLAETSDKTLRIDGSDSMTAINQLLQQRYEEQFPDAAVKLRSSSTEAGIEKLINDQIDLAAIGRSLTAAEKAKGLIEIPISREKIAIIIGRDNPFTGNLTIEQLTKIFRGEITNWAEVGGPEAEIRVIDRPELSDTRLALRRYPMFRDPQFTASETVVHLNDDDTAAVVAALGDNGISYAIASQVVNQDQARIVKLTITQDVLPDDALYPYGQVRGYAYKQEPSDAVQSFLGFATAKPGQAAVAAAKLAEAKAVAAGEKPVLSPTAQPVSQPIDAGAPPLGFTQPDAVSPANRQPSIFLWLVLPLVLIGLLIRWLLQRQAKPPAAPVPTPAPAPLTTPPAVEPPAETVGVTINLDALDEDLDADWIEPAEFATEITSPEVSAPSMSAEEIAAALIAPEVPAEVISDLAVAPEATAEPESEVLFQEPEPETLVEFIASEPENPVEGTVDQPVEVESSWLNSEPSISERLVVEIIEVTESEVTESEVTESEVVEPDIEELVFESVPEPASGESASGESASGQSVSGEAASGQMEAEIITVEWIASEPQPETLDEVESGEVLALETPLAPEPLAAPEPVSEPVSEPLTEPIAAIAFPEPLPVAAPLAELIDEMTSFQQVFLSYLNRYDKVPATATSLEAYTALAAMLCDRLLNLNTPMVYLSESDARIVGEISAEFMPGPHLENSLINLGLLDEATAAMQELGLDLRRLIDQEEEPGLGRGGLGRLMVCYLDSLSTANVPAIGYGLRYEYGIFDQKIQDGWQVEVTDTWLRHGNPWEVERPDQAIAVQFGGTTEAYMDEQGRYRVRWAAAETLQGIPYDTPIPGCQTATVNLLRLWRADASDLCKVLYPIDADAQGKVLRLKQQFFLVSCALQDVLRLHQFTGEPETLADRFALQLNDTDPALGIAELMRLLVDEQGIAWEQAWEITQRTCAYTNHSLMPETLDNLWTVKTFGDLLPRHLEIIYEINYRLLEAVKAKYGDDLDRLNRMSLIDERGERYIRTNFLACVGSHAVNGVSLLHTDLLKQTALRDFYEMNPEKFSNQTNGVTPRRFLLQGNPELAALMSRTIGESWITNLDELQRLEAFAEDAAFRNNWRQVKHAAKQKLATQILQQCGIQVDPSSLFDVQAMVMHEYKRQHLNVLHILTLYNRLKANPDLDLTPRTFIFAGKAAPDYFIAKLMIKLIHAVGAVVNADPIVRNRLKVVFLPDLNIKTAQPIHPAADLVEHISVAGTEAGDTGNLIAALNGALVIGTLDGTNIELQSAIGAENFFQFGLTAPEVAQRRAHSYNPMEVYYANPELRAAIDLIASGELAGGDGELFKPLVNLLLYYDRYMLLADYASYLECQERVSRAYQDTAGWTRRSILSTARMGKFSSDRAIRAYCQEIWQITPTAMLEEIPAKKSVG